LRANSSGLGRTAGAHPVFSDCGEAGIQAWCGSRSKSILSASSMSRSLLQSQCFALSSASLRLSRRRYSRSSGGLCFGFPPGLPERLGKAFKANANLACPARVALSAASAHCCAFCLSRLLALVRSFFSLRSRPKTANRWREMALTAARPFQEPSGSRLRGWDRADQVRSCRSIGKTVKRRWKKRSKTIRWLTVFTPWHRHRRRGMARLLNCCWRLVRSPGNAPSRASSGRGMPTCYRSICGGSCRRCALLESRFRSNVKGTRGLAIFRSRFTTAADRPDGPGSGHSLARLFGDSY